MKINYTAIFFCLCIFNIANGQSNSNLNSIATEESTSDWLKLKPTIVVSADNFFHTYGELFGLSSNDNLILSKMDSDNLGFVHERFEQYYAGIKIEGAQYILHSKEGRVVSANGKIISGLNLNITPTVLEEFALTTAFNCVESKEYAWQDSNQVNIWIHNQNKKLEDLYPKGKLVIACKQKEFSKSSKDFILAWRFEIRTARISDSRIVYVDANTNQLISVLPIAPDCIPTAAQTTWHGTQSISTTYNGSNYILDEQCFNHGDIHTVDYYYAWNSEYTDGDNIWTTNNQEGAEAHRNGRMTLDFFYNYFNRNSFDNAGSTIHIYNEDFTDPNNAHWDGSNGVYLGNGGSSSAYDDFGTIDIVAHEITHGVTQNSAGLNYINESGALNEAFSDILGTGAERYYEGACCFDWLIGEDRNGGTLYTRSLSDPKNWGAHITGSGNFAIGQPNTYQGTYWYTGTLDYGGVHVNSGVLNYWFYLLSQGGSGTNDNGYSYTFSGIGFNDAVLIVNRTLTVYLSPASVYGDAKIGSFQAAIDLFGSGSTQYNTVVDAWCAVGLGISCSGNGCTPPATPITISPGTSGYPGTNVGTLTPTFDWNTVSGATNYTLSISIYPYGSSNIIFSQCLGNPPYILPGGYLSNNNYYRWDVQANVSCGTCVSGYATDKYFNTVGGGGTQPNLFAQSGGAGMNGNVANYNYTVGNNGTANASSFSINFYVCTSSTFTNPTWVSSDYVSSGLMIGGTYSSQANIDLCSAGLPNGTYYLGFYIDYSNQVSESNENDNNTFYSFNSYTINCTTGGQPNLFSQSGGAGMTGNLANFNYTIGNSGTGNSGSFYINCYVCTTSSFTNPIFVGSDYASQGLQTGATYSSQINVNLCNAGLPSGTYYLGFYIDYSNQVAESNENDNNTFYSSNSYTTNCSGGGGQPNLYNVSGWTRATSNIASFQYTIGNNGNANAGAFSIECYASTSPTFSSPLFVAADNVTAGLAVGATYTHQIDADLCAAGLPSGSYYLAYFIDYLGQVNEIYESDNDIRYPSISFPINCGPLPELVEMSGGSSYLSNNLSINYDIGNVGTANAGSFTIGIYLCTSPSYANPIWINTDYVSPGLNIGNTYSNSFNFDLCSVGLNASQTYYFGVYVDYLNQVTESNEVDNNVFAYQAPMTLNCPPPCGVPTANFAASQTSGNCPMTVDFFDLSSTSGNTNWLWTIYNGGGFPVTSTLQNPTGIPFNNAGSFLVKLQVTDSCGTDAKITPNYITVNCPTGISNLYGINNFIIYPNPAVDKINIVGTGLPNDSYSITLTNTLGQILKVANVKSLNDSFDFQLDLTEFLSGIYLLSISSEKSKQVFKINKL